jgi:hypothetical protein
MIYARPQIFFDEEAPAPNDGYAQIVDAVSKMPGGSIMQKLDVLMHKALDPSEQFIINAICVDKTPVADLSKSYNMSKIAIEEVKARGLLKLREKIGERA